MAEALDIEENQARRAGHHVIADSGENQPEADREDRLWNVITAQADEGRKGEQHQRKDFRVAELQRDGGQRRCKSREKNVRDRAADKGCNRSHHERAVRTARHGHGSAIEGRRHRSRGAGYP